jgi:hypothetical protein
MYLVLVRFRSFKPLDLTYSEPRPHLRSDIAFFVIHHALAFGPGTSTSQPHPFHPSSVSQFGGGH